MRHDRECSVAVDELVTIAALLRPAGYARGVPDDPRSFPEQISRACHDLRTPLASAFGFARTLERLGAVEGEHARYLSIVVEATEELGRLIDCLALLARAEDGRIVLEPAPVDDARARARGGRELVPGEPLSARGDGAAIDVDARARALGPRVARRGGRARRPGRCSRSRSRRGRTARSRSGPLSQVMADRFAGGAGDLRASAALAVARAHGGTLAREDDRIVLRLAPT